MKAEMSRVGMTKTTSAAGRLTERINRIEVSATLAVVNEAAKLKAAGADLVDFGAGEPHFSTPAHIKRAGIEAIEKDFTKYTPVSGTMELRQAIARRHDADFGSGYTAEQAMASVGGKHALFNAIQVLVEHGDEVIVPVPYWVSFKDIVRYAGGECVFVESEEASGFNITAAAIEAAITPRTRAIILNSPNNPSGAVMPPEEFEAVVRLAAKLGIYVIADECYVYLNYTGRLFSAGTLAGGEAGEAVREHLIIAGSLSKTYAMTGWRLGYVLAPAALVAAMNKLQSQSTSNPSSMVQKAGIAALTGPQECVAEMSADYVRLRDLLVDGLGAIPGVRCTRPEGAFYAYPNVSSFFGRGGIRSAADVATRLLHEAKVVTVPGEAFGTTEHIRLSYATSAKEIGRGLERMRSFFAGL